jgi:hypothetical protein
VYHCFPASTVGGFLNLLRKDQDYSKPVIFPPEVGMDTGKSFDWSTAIYYPTFKLKGLNILFFRTTKGKNQDLFIDRFRSLLIPLSSIKFFAFQKK